MPAAMSAPGQTRSFDDVRAKSGSPPTSDIRLIVRHGSHGPTIRSFIRSNLSSISDQAESADKGDELNVTCYSLSVLSGVF
jgi:hypothetical protein